MLWLSRPPYLRWFAALAVVVAAFLWDLSGRQTALYPFAAIDVQRGSVISDGAIAWKDVPAGVFRVPDLIDATAVTDIAAGDPISTSLLKPAISIPEGWWAIPITLPRGVFPGAAVRIVLPDGQGVTGVVVDGGSSDSFGSLEPASVAFPSDLANVVAQLAAVGELVVLVEP